MRAVSKLVLLLAALPVCETAFAQQAVPPQYAPPRIVLPPPGYYVPRADPIPSPFVTPNAYQSGGVTGGSPFVTGGGQLASPSGASPFAPAGQLGSPFAAPQTNSPFGNVVPRVLQQVERLAPGIRPQTPQTP